MMSKQVEREFDEPVTMQRVRQSNLAAQRRAFRSATQQASASPIRRIVNRGQHVGQNHRL
jgi:hypothetical protein